MEIDKEKILEELKKINDNVTEETIKNASKEDLIKYMRLIDEIKDELFEE